MPGVYLQTRNTERRKGSLEIGPLLLLPKVSHVFLCKEAFFLLGLQELKDRIATSLKLKGLICTRALCPYW